MAEFTGERVIPGEVDPDLWNEHVARYAFAARMAREKRVLDAGCGSGYGAVELARVAREVLAIDISQGAIDYARAHYANTDVRFQCASCLEIPAPDGSFDLAVAFEIIEHLNDWSAFLHEVRRVLAPDGLFVVSTPNKIYYAEARAALGPNPFHVHEFDPAEFRRELEAVFPHVHLYLENHTDAIVVSPSQPHAAMELHVEETQASPEQAHFLLAVCGAASELPVPGFVYVPRAANMLLERERHIEMLESEVRERIARIVQLQDELASEQAKARKRIGELETELQETVAAATRIATELDAKCSELAQCVEYLHTAERTVDERTRWAQRTQAEADELARQLNALRSTRWVRLGSKLRFIPQPGAGQ